MKSAGGLVMIALILRSVVQRDSRRPMSLEQGAARQRGQKNYRNRERKTRNVRSSEANSDTDEDSSEANEVPDLELDRATPPPEPTFCVWSRRVARALLRGLLLPHAMLRGVRVVHLCPRGEIDGRDAAGKDGIRLRERARRGDGAVWRPGGVDEDGGLPAVSGP